MRIKTTISMVLLGLWLVAAPACSKKDDKEKNAPAGDKADKNNKAGKPGAPDLATIKAVDCDKACNGQLACYKKAGMTMASDEETLKACNAGCAMLKSDAGSADLKVTVGTQMLAWAAGKCQ